MNGWEATRLLNGDAETAGIPAVAVMGGDHRDQARFPEAGSCAFRSQCQSPASPGSTADRAAPSPGSEMGGQRPQGASTPRGRQSGIASGMGWSGRPRYSGH